jgi:hypothetical protein
MDPGKNSVHVAELLVESWKSSAHTTELFSEILEKAGPHGGPFPHPCITEMVFHRRHLICFHPHRVEVSL